MHNTWSRPGVNYSFSLSVSLQLHSESCFQSYLCRAALHTRSRTMPRSDWWTAQGSSIKLSSSQRYASPTAPSFYLMTKSGQKNKFSLTEPALLLKHHIVFRVQLRFVCSSILRFSARSCLRCSTSVPPLSTNLHDAHCISGVTTPKPDSTGLYHHHRFVCYNLAKVFYI